MIINEKCRTKETRGCKIAYLQEMPRSLVSQLINKEINLPGHELLALRKAGMRTIMY